MKLRLKAPPHCAYCKRVINDAGSNRQAMHEHCENFLLQRGTDVRTKRLIQNRQSNRRRAQGLYKLASRPEAPRPSNFLPLAKPLEHDLCGRTHETVGDLRACLERYERSLADVRSR